MVGKPQGDGAEVGEGIKSQGESETREEKQMLGQTDEDEGESHRGHGARQTSPSSLVEVAPW